MRDIIKNKTIFFLTIFIFVFSYIFFLKNKVGQIGLKNSVKSTKIKIAACPTCYQMGKRLDNLKYEIIATETTAESLSLMQNGQVDLILAGRTLKPSEPQANYLIIEEGYSFLSSKTKTLYEYELKNYPVYTDLDIDIIKTKFDIDEVFQIEDVYQFLDKGIVVTSWENTDYTRAEIIHLLKESGERVVLARRPTLYCPGICGADAREIIGIIKDNLKGGENL